jgi:hypothetical protein
VAHDELRYVFTKLRDAPPQAAAPPPAPLRAWPSWWRLK